MAVTSSVSSVQYNGNGATTVFAFTFEVFDDDDLVVNLVNSTTGAATLQVRGTHYTVSGVGLDAGGNVTFITAPASGNVVDIRTDMDLTQPTVFRNQGAFLPSSHEQAMDRIVREIIQVNRRADLAVRLPDLYDAAGAVNWDTLLSLANRKGKYFGYFNATTGAPELFTSIGATTLSQSVIGEFLHPQTPAEALAGVTPTNYYIKPGEVRRYGYVADDSTDNSTAISNAMAQMAQTGGAPVEFPSGVGRFSTSQNIPTGGVVRGQGKSKTILRYTGAAQAFKQATPSSRIYEIHVSDLSIYNIGTGTVGLDLESVSTSTFERLWIDGFTTGVRIHSPTSGYAVYNRFWDVTVNAPANSKGFVLSGTSSNANRFFGCRFNGASVTGTIGWEITDSNGNSITNCETDFAATHVVLTASAPGLTDGNVLYGNRIENATTGYSVGANVRHTNIGGNYYTIVTTQISDSGTNTMVSDPYYAAPGTSARYAAASSADGHIRLIREPSGGSSLPFMRLVDENTGAGTPITLQIETERSTGSFMRGRRGGATYIDVRADGNVALLAAGILRAVGAGTPEGALTAPIGSTYQRTDGGAGTSFYVKESGTGNTGWVAK